MEEPQGLPKKDIITHEEVLWKGLDIVRGCHLAGENCSIIGTEEDRGIIIDRLMSHESSDGCIMHRISIPKDARVSTVLELLSSQINIEGKMRFNEDPAKSKVRNLVDLISQYYNQFPLYKIQKKRPPDIFIFENLEDRKSVV